MKTEPLEERIRRTPLRPPPLEWREDILRYATSVRADDRLTADATLPTAALVGAWLRRWLFPSPVAWAAIAATWVVILGLNALDPAARSGAAGPQNASPRLELQAILDHSREVARMFEEQPEAVQPQSRRVYGPRSQSQPPIRYA